MGRTAPTYGLVVALLASAVGGPFRRARRAADRATFDAMLNHAREYASAGSNLAALDPVVPVLLSVLLAHEAELARLRRALAVAQAAAPAAAPVATPAAAPAATPAAAPAATPAATAPALAGAPADGTQPGPVAGTARSQAGSGG